MRQRSGYIPATEQEPVGVHCSCGYNDISGPHSLERLYQQSRRPIIAHLVPGTICLKATQWPNVPHCRFELHLGAPFLGKIQIILYERVFGIFAATDHAGTTVGASAAIRPLSAKVRVRNQFARILFIEKDSNLGRAESMAFFKIVCGSLEDVICRPEPRVGCYTQHAFGCIVVWAKDTLPVSKVSPLGYG